jgi:hypothetical protein
LFFLLLSSASLALGQSPAPRQTSRSLASLPAPKAGGAPRILLVVDDWDRSNGAPVFRKLVADAVGGDAKAWSSVVVKQNEHGPSADKLRDFNVVVWYTGALYGGGYISTLSEEDEKTVRRYLQETGGAFILVSPGFLSTRVYGTSWTKSDNPFLKEVVGIAGFADLVQRFSAGTVRTPGGETFAVQEKGTVETQFTAVNPDGAAVVFTATLDPAKTAQGPVPVAVAHAYGSGRFVYVGFSLENMAEAERAKAFGAVLAAATGPRTAVAAAPALSLPAQKSAAPNQAIKPAPPGPAPMNLQMSVGTPGTHSVAWTYADWTNNLADRPRSYEVYRRDPGGWTLLGTRQLEGGKGQKVDGFTDESFRPTGTAYRVVTVYADGRRGEAEIQYPNPPQPTLPTGLIAAQVRWDGVRLQWDSSNNGVSGYRLYGPGLPASGYTIRRADFEHRLWRPQLSDFADPFPGTGDTYPVLADIYRLGSGEHEFRLAHEYGRAGIAPISTTVKVRVNAQPPPVPTDLRVEQNGYRRITLRWKPPANTYNGYPVINAAGMGASGRGAVVRPGNDQWIEFREVPEGAHTIRMGYAFPHEPQPPAQAEVTFTVVDMTKTSNDISSCPGLWVTDACLRPSSDQGGKGKGGGFGGGKKR